MPSNRVRGQEVEITLVKDGQPLDAIANIKSFEFKYEMETQSEGYLGERTERKDSIFKGISGSFEIHHEKKTLFEMFRSLVDRAKRRTPGVTVNIKATINYNNGERLRVVFPDVEFGEIPVNIGSRTDYVSTSLDFVCSDCTEV
jgi:hypothetical protein